LAENGVAMVVPDAKRHPAGMLMSFHQHHAQAAIAHSQIGMSQPLKNDCGRSSFAQRSKTAAVLRGIGSDHATALSAMAAG
jgi:CRISPR-associated protein Cas1